MAYLHKYSISDIDLLQKKAIIECQESFWAYRQYINKKLKLGWWQKEIAKELQQFWNDYLAGLRPKLVIQAPPQHGKSVQIVDFITWMLGNNPELKVIYASFSERLGVRANTKIKKILSSEKYAAVFPKTEIGSPLTQEIIGINDEGFFRNTTCGGQITGESLDLGIIDDPIKGREAANSETIRDKTWDWFTDDFSTRFADNGALLCILTRWHVDDPIGRLLAADSSIKVLSYPALSNQYKGGALFPEHKSVEFLEGIKKRMSAASWESLYQQNPIIMEGNLFKPDQMQVIHAIPEGCRFIRAWDLAATVNGGDYTVGVKLAITPNKDFIVCDVARFQRSPEEVRKAILSTANLDGVTTTIFIPQEPGQAGKAQIVSFVQMLNGFHVKTEPVRGDKITRAEPVASQCNVGNISIFSAGWNSRFIDELRTFPNGVNDDQVDAFADAYHYCQKPVNQPILSGKRVF